MTIVTEDYPTQVQVWPASGQHILAQYDDRTIIVYQAYRPEIAEYALKTGTFGGSFSYSRMSWIKPNFLWMMFRSGWATKPDQEVVLALRINRRFFDALLVEAVASGFAQSGFAQRTAWKQAVAASDVRLQWDPDHAPDGSPVARRAIQLGLRGKALERYGQSELVEVIDMTPLIDAQRGADHDRLHLPKERVYRPRDPAIAGRIGLDDPGTA